MYLEAALEEAEKQYEQDSEETMSRKKRGLDSKEVRGAVCVDFTM